MRLYLFALASAAFGASVEPSEKDQALSTTKGLAQLMRLIQFAFPNTASLWPAGPAEAIPKSKTPKENQFIFPDTPSDPCSILEDEEPAEFLQSILESYGLGYALLFAHRLDTCSGDQQLVKNLHSDLYKWLSNQKLGKEYAQIFKELGLVVDLKQLARLSEIGATLLVERLSIEQITSKMEKEEKPAIGSTSANEIIDSSVEESSASGNAEHFTESERIEPRPKPVLKSRKTIPFAVPVWQPGESGSEDDVTEPETRKLESSHLGSDQIQDGKGGSC